MFQSILSYVAAGGIGAAIWKFGEYLIKRRIERRGQTESVELDRKELELIDFIVTNREKWEAAGHYVEMPASIQGKVTQSLTPTQWTDAYATLGAHLLKRVHGTCMWFESIADSDPEYQYALNAHRNEFLRWYSATTEFAPIIFDKMPTEITRVIHAYFHRLTEPTQINVDGFRAALTELKHAMDTGVIRVSRDN
jgi:hypothetical protein